MNSQYILTLAKNLVPKLTTALHKGQAGKIILLWHLDLFAIKEGWGFLVEVKSKYFIPYRICPISVVTLVHHISVP